MTVREPDIALRRPRDVQFGEADLTDCDREPIRVPGSIQAHGVLLALDPVSLRVVQVAGDTERLMGRVTADLLGKTLESGLGVSAMERLGELVEHDQLLPRPFFVFDAYLDDTRFAVSAHLSGGLVVLELEPFPVPAAQDGVALVQKMTGSVQATRDLPSLLDAVAREVQQASGFDRVMIYRFADDNSGHVVAEHRRSDAVDSFLDLHYPASDIPAQARDLYCSCWIRYVPDAAYSPRPLEPAVNPHNGRPLDMSFGLLRSVSPVHLEYLANMGVAASMSLSIVIDGRLWGLIACHHHTPHYLSCHVRAALELFAQLSSLQVKTRLELDLSVDRVRSRDILAGLVGAMTVDGLAALTSEPASLLALVNAQGVAVILDGHIQTFGSTPPGEHIAPIAAWLDGRATGGVVAVPNLPDRLPTVGDAAPGATGLLALGISRQPHDYVLWFLPEIVRAVTWGGKPDKVVAPGPLGDRLTPRKSFEAWVETVRGASRAWSSMEIESAAALRTAILEVVLQNADQFAQEQQAARRHQDLLMAELDHRVKNTLATIQALVRSSSGEATDLVAFTHSLQQRLRAMAGAHDLLTERRWMGAPLRALVESALHSHRAVDDARIRMTGEPVDLDAKGTIAIALVIHELSTNAAKYGSLSTTSGSVAVDWAQVSLDGAAWLKLRWTESGGPTVVEPTRTGFGRLLLEQAFAYDVRGRVDLRFDPEGLSCDLWIPLDRILNAAAVEADRTG